MYLFDTPSPRLDEDSTTSALWGTVNEEIKLVTAYTHTIRHNTTSQKKSFNSPKLSIKYIYRCVYRIYIIHVVFSYTMYVYMYIYAPTCIFFLPIEIK